MKKIIFILTIFFVASAYGPGSEFTVEKKQKTKTPSSSKLKEDIVRASADVLKLQAQIDELEARQRNFLLSELESALQEDKTSFFVKAKKAQLQECLCELESLKDGLNQRLLNFNEKFSTLKDKFIV